MIRRRMRQLADHGVVSLQCKKRGWNDDEVWTATLFVDGRTSAAMTSTTARRALNALWHSVQLEQRRRDAVAARKVA